MLKSINSLMCQGLGSRPKSLTSIRTTTLSQMKTKTLVTSSPCPLSQSRREISVYSSSSGSSSVPEKLASIMGDGGRTIRRFAWVSFWIQLTLSLVSTVIMTFQLMLIGAAKVTAAQIITTVAAVLGIISTFWTFQLIKLGRRLISYSIGQLDSRIGLSKLDVQVKLFRGTQINLLGMGTAILGLAALVGQLFAKSAMTSNASLFQQAQPVVALDVLIVQAATNGILCHFVSMVVNTWLTQIVSKKF